MKSQIDEVDAKIIIVLQADGRTPNTEIARRVGIAEATVRKRIDRLRQEKVIRVGAWADPLKIGYQTYGNIEIQVNPPDIEKVAERLARLPEIFFLGICTGGFDILASAVFHSNEHMYEFMTKRLTRVPGIQRTSTSNVIRVVKREYALPFIASTDPSRQNRKGSGSTSTRPTRRQTGRRHS
jgi:Lrp/AsnC family transcriptional regulator for asnA, asnC and gidA